MWKSLKLYGNPVNSTFWSTTKSFLLFFIDAFPKGFTINSYILLYLILFQILAKHLQTYTYRWQPKWVYHILKRLFAVAKHTRKHMLGINLTTALSVINDSTTHQVSIHIWKPTMYVKKSLTLYGNLSAQCTLSYILAKNPICLCIATYVNKGSLGWIKSSYENTHWWKSPHA